MLEKARERVLTVLLVLSQKAALCPPSVAKRWMRKSNSTEIQDTYREIGGLMEFRRRVWCQR